ncbi:kirola-like [Cucumis melo var. makuwa]|uniref:Kirola-like n=1 Tax=Cucumis melo var. makuwa TaxID=1194695 RepID=A0A5D3DYG3_CUCMM|nr:kirola-like [Cucumis melo var. makuwa]
MVSEWDIQHTLEDTTSNGNQTEEIATSFSTTVAAVVDAHISATYGQMVSLPSNNTGKCITVNSVVACGVKHASRVAANLHVLPSDLHVTVAGATCIAYIVPHAPIRVLPPNSDWPPPLLLSNLYALPFSTNLSYYPNVKNPQIHPIFEISPIEATLETTSKSSVLMYYENPVTSFPTLFSSYVSENVSPTTLGAIIQSDIAQFFSLISINGKNPWILDAGATDHLIGSSKHFVSYIPYPGNENS